MNCIKCGRAGEFVGDVCGVCAGTCKETDYARRDAGTMSELELSELFKRAHAMGMEAGMLATPTPMVIQGYAPIMNGACGFAWITIRPGNSRAARFAVKHHGAHKAYNGGVQVWVSEFNQSMACKEAYARAYSMVLELAGIKAYPGSRMD